MYGNFLLFMGRLNCVFALINLLPIPGLDGGLILFKLSESIFKFKWSAHMILLIHRLSFIIFAIAFIHIAIFDILRNVS